MNGCLAKALRDEKYICSPIPIISSTQCTEFYSLSVSCFYLVLPPMYTFLNIVIYLCFFLNFIWIESLCMQSFVLCFFCSTVRLILVVDSCFFLSFFCHKILHRTINFWEILLLIDIQLVSIWSYEKWYYKILIKTSCVRVSPRYTLRKGVPGF